MRKCGCRRTSRRCRRRRCKTLREWIDAGLPWEAGFTFAVRDYEPPLRPRRPELPPAVDGRTNPVDRILDAYLKRARRAAAGAAR